MTDTPKKLDEETEQRIRGVMTTFKPEHPAHIALRSRIRTLIEEARKEAFKEGYDAETRDEAWAKGIRGDA